MSGPADEVDLPAAQEILRRAVRLDHDVAEPGALSRAELEAAAAELGVQPMALAMALAEAAVGVPTRRRPLERLVGPRVVTAVRPCTVPADRARELVVEWLERAHLLRVLEEPDGSVVGRRRHDPAATAGRAVRSLHGGGGLSRIDEVRAGVGVVADGSAAVCLRADVSDRRAGAVVTGALFGGLGLVAVGVGTVTLGPLLLLAVPAAVGLGVAAARQAHHDTVRRVGRAVDETAAAAAKGTPPRSTVAGLGRAVRRIAPR